FSVPLETGRSLNVLTMIVHLKDEKPSSDTSCETLDTFACCPSPERLKPHSLSSAHTYRLLVFKEHIARALPPQLPSCVAASAAEKRDYEQRFGSCQQDSKRFLIDSTY
ncbi:hypothetical protein, partial [Caballeronia sp. EK]|uniref:hypothetical protein n=1 Tax=Caballeronia sp. EK TaxID=2767469 RepID=UPI001CA3FEE2